MKEIYEIIVAIIIMFALTGCSCRSDKTEDGVSLTPRTSVTLTEIKYGNITEYLSLIAESAYLGKSGITSPVASYIKKVYVTPGSQVHAGDRLFSIETKEQHALMNPNAPDIEIKASASGIVMDVLQQAGDYATEGTPLCTIADKGSLVFEINVPAGQIKEVPPGKKCLLLMPDGERINAEIDGALATMDIDAQTYKVLCRAQVPFMPEGVRLTALINIDTGKKTRMILPRQAVQSDESLENHWVMKLINDSMAVKVPISIGNGNSDSVEVMSDKLHTDDRIVASGAYALADSSLVTIENYGK